MRRHAASRSAAHADAMWFGVAPVTPPHVRRREERYQQEQLEVQPGAGGSGAALCSPRGRAGAGASVSVSASPCPSPSVTPRARELPLVTGRHTGGGGMSGLRALSLSPRGHASASDGRADAGGRGRRRPRVPVQSPRRSGPAPLSTSDQCQQQDEEEAPEDASTRESGKSRGRRRSALDEAPDAGNQRAAGGAAGGDSAWTTKEQSERGPDAVASRPTTRSSSTASSTTRPRQERWAFVWWEALPLDAQSAHQAPVSDSPNPAMPRSRRASRRLSRADAAAVPASSVDTPATPYGGLLLPFLSRIGERLSFSRGSAGATAATTSTLPESLVGHTSSVCALAASDDRVIVSCSRDGLVKLWSRVTFTCLQTLSGHDDNVSCVDVQGNWLVSGSHDTTLRLYHRRRRRSLLGTEESHAGGCEFELHCVLRGHMGHVTKVQLPETLPGLALSCSDDATLRLWSAKLAQCVLVLSLHTSRVTCFTVYPIDSGESTAAMGDFLVCSGAADAAVCFWEVLSTSRANQRGDELGSHDDPHVLRSRACHVHRSTVQCVAVVTGDPAASTTAGVSSSTSFTPLLVSGSNDGTIQLFNLLTFEHLALLHDCQAPVYALAATSSGRLVSATRDGRLLVFGDVPRFFAAPPRDRPLVELKVAPTWLSSLQLRGDLVACCGEDTLYIASIAVGAGSVLRAIDTKHGFINCVRWIHSRAVVTCGQDHVVKLWNTAA